MTAEASTASAARPNPLAGITGKWWFWMLVVFLGFAIVGYDVWGQTKDSFDEGHKPLLGFLGEGFVRFLRAVTEPVAIIWTSPGFFVETGLTGLLVGVLYSLVALGFVLIYKASGMFNYAQGVMVLFAGLSFVGLTEINLQVSGFSAIWFVFLIIALVGAVVLAAYYWAARKRPTGTDLSMLPARARTLGVLGYALFYLGMGLGIMHLLSEDGIGAWSIVIYCIVVALCTAFYVLRVRGICFVAENGSFSVAGRTIMNLFLFLGVVMIIVGLWASNLPPWLSIILTIVIMIAFAQVVEALILRHLVNQEQIILFMATIGLAFFLEGFGDTIWGSNVKKIPLDLPSGRFEPFTIGEPFASGKWTVGVEWLDISAAIVGALMVIALAVFFNKTRIGRALRAVADDHQAALSVGINLRTIWIIVWAVAGIVALFAGIVWGAAAGIQFSLSLIALKALPVLLIGGFESIPGAIVAGLIVGFAEKIAEVTWGEAMGGAIENWFAFMLAMVFLVIRPQGLFGEKIIERV